MESRHALQFRIYVVILAVVLAAGFIGLITLEKFSALDAIYFTISTISTVGFGDLHPVTTAGKILVIFIILTGVGCFVGLVANSIEFLIDEREHRIKLEKLNMIIGAFFSVAGTHLIKKFSSHDPIVGEISGVLHLSNAWTDEDFSRAETVLKNHTGKIDSRTIDLNELHVFLTDKKSFFLSLLANPQMIEHDSFTPLIQAVFHLAEELIARDHLDNLPPSDYDHLSGDINRVYLILIFEWLAYMRYLKRKYPYLFSLAMRTNPFDANASAYVK